MKRRPVSAPKRRGRPPGPSRYAAAIRKLAEKGRTLQQIGDALGITRQRVHQIMPTLRCEGARRRARREQIQARQLEHAFATDPRSEIISEAALSLHRRGHAARVEMTKDRTALRLYIGARLVRIHVPPRWYSPYRVPYYRFSVSRTCRRLHHLLVATDGTRLLFLGPLRTSTVYVRADDLSLPMAVKPALVWRPRDAVRRAA